MGPIHIQVGEAYYKQYIYIYGGDRTGRYLGGHLKILPTIMLSNVERINE